ncbi:hypothetical protein SAY87_008782 [Trapa incisa]|uniref:Uncharacterized protein n=1 Tax=Trapa incisa TaxID=236973 RepID=A0AAN7JU74_9MYRT|nr:hypothetical protein SAY87_008782 [Trapa incisa]
MGCCASTHDYGSSASASPKQSRAFSHPSVEEETVKEVLSETPNPTPPIHHTKYHPQNPKPQKQLPVYDRVSDPLSNGPKTGKNGVMQARDALDRMEDMKPKAAMEISEEAWEECSQSESPSISTPTNLTGDGGFRHYQLGHRAAQRSPAKTPSRTCSFSGDMGAPRCDRTGQTHGRRSEQSPRRTSSGPLRTATGGEPGRSRSEPRRRERVDPSEGSAKRSRSPGTDCSANVLTVVLTWIPFSNSIKNDIPSRASTVL